MSGPTFVDEELEKYWSALSLFERSNLVMSLGVTGKDKRQESLLDGKSMDEIVSSSQGDLPGLVRGRLICALTPEGFSVAEYERVRDSMISTSSVERAGN
jgi:hypothetical protein